MGNSQRENGDLICGEAMDSRLRGNEPGLRQIPPYYYPVFIRGFYMFFHKFPGILFVLFVSFVVKSKDFTPRPNHPAANIADRLQAAQFASTRITFIPVSKALLWLLHIRNTTLPFHPHRSPRIRQASGHIFHQIPKDRLE